MATRKIWKSDESILRQPRGCGTALSMGEVYFDNNCKPELKDKNGRCPGEMGFIPQVLPSKPEDSSFAAFQKAMAEKKKKAADALKKK